MTLRSLVVLICVGSLLGGMIPGGAFADEPEPRTVREHLIRGRQLMTENRIDEAVEMLRRATELDPEDQSACYFLAGAYWQAGKPDSSLHYVMHRKELSAAATLQRLRDERGNDLASTAEEVIARHVEAIGGREAASAVQTMVVEFTANSTNGNSATVRRQYKRPAYYRQEVVGSDRFVATDGETTWRVNGGVWQEIDETSYLHMASIDDYLVDYEAHGVRYGFVGVEIFADTPVYHLERTFRDGFRQDLFFSIDTGVLTEVRSEYPVGNPVMMSVMSLWDYRDVGGLRIPFVFIRNVGALGPPHGGVVQEVKVNVPLEDSLFVKPPSAASG